jgi:hypothetical protein
MAEHELELRLRAVARALDAQAPTFDPAVLRDAPRRRIRPKVVALAAAVALVALAAAPAAVSGLRDLFGVDEVKDLGPVAPDVTPPFEGRQVPPHELQRAVPFPVRTISAHGAPDAAYVRDDIAGGMATVVYRDGRILLTQWPADRVDARIAVVPASGRAEKTRVGGLPALWIEGTARGTFTLIGADGGIHRERFDIGTGVLLWKEDGIAFLLQGAGSKVEATRLAAEVG